MNKQHIRFHLQEASDAILALLSELDSDPEYEYGNYVVDVSHLYHHINTAWNGRDATEDEVVECSAENFQKWRTLPGSGELMLDSE